MGPGVVGVEEGSAAVVAAEAAGRHLVTSRADLDHGVSIPRWKRPGRSSTPFSPTRARASTSASAPFCRAAAVLMGRLRASLDGPGPLADLTEQERALLGLIGEGLTNRQIAERMFLAEKTVKNYVSRLLAKLGMERRTQAAVFASKLDHHSAS